MESRWSQPAVLMSNIDLTKQEPPSDFGIRLMDGEEVIFSLRPSRFVRYAVISVAVTIVGILFCASRFGLGPDSPAALSLLGLTNKRVIWCHGFIGYKVR